MRRTMSAPFCSSLKTCSGGDSFSAFFSPGGRAAALRHRRRSDERRAMVFPIASKSSSTPGGECASFVNFGSLRRFRGREERRFGGGVREENTTTYTTTTHLQKRGFVLASSNGINNNNEQLKLFSVSRVLS